MASLGQQRFYKKGVTGEIFDFQSKVSVSKDGCFRMTIPDELEPSVQSLRSKFQDCDFAFGRRGAVRHYGERGNLAVYGKTKDRVEAYIHAAMNDHLAAEEIVERVIVYGYEDCVAYFKNGDGKIFENGTPEGAKYGKGGSEWHGKLSATQGSNFYSVGVAAEVYDKHTFRRPTGEVVEYQKPSGIPNFSQCPIGRLNGFVGLHISNPERLSEMPYTDEAADFFFNMMLTLCRLADQVSAFLGNETTVVRAIENGSGPLLLSDNS